MILEKHDKLLFMGDSITDCERARPVGEGLWAGVGNGYVRCVDTLLSVLYPELFIHVVNMGQNGANSADIVDLWEEHVMKQKPDRVVLLVGGNDVWRQFDSPTDLSSHIMPEDYAENLRTVIRRTLPHVKSMILMEPYFIESNENDALKIRMKEYAAVARDVAGEFGLMFVELQREFDEYLKLRHPNALSWDRVHPGWVGSMIIARKFLRDIGVDRELF